MSLQLTETIIYTNPNSDYTSWRISNLNTSGLGTSQNVSCITPTALIIGQTVTVTVQAPVPCPQWYFSTVSVADSIQVYTTQNVPITLSSTETSLLPNASYFQPNPGQKFNIIYKAGAAVAVNGPMFYIQAVVKNTLSQFIDLSTIHFEHYDPSVKEGKVKAWVDYVVTLNTTSAIENTIRFNFENYPIPDSENALVSFKGLLNAQGVVSYGSLGAAIGNTTTYQYQIVGGQYGALLYPGGKFRTYTGSIFMYIGNIGLVTLPATTFSIAAPSIFDVTEFSSGVTSGGMDSGIATAIEELTKYVRDMPVHSQALVPVEQANQLDEDSICNRVVSHMSSMDIDGLRAVIDMIMKATTTLKRTIDDLKTSNASEHMMQNKKLSEILAIVKNMSSEEVVEES